MVDIPNISGAMFSPKDFTLRGFAVNFRAHQRICLEQTVSRVFMSLSELIFLYHYWTIEVCSIDILHLSHVMRFAPPGNPANQEQRKHISIRRTSFLRYNYIYTCQVQMLCRQPRYLYWGGHGWVLGVSWEVFGWSWGIFLGGSWAI
jgi:hypothetical protein